MTPHISTVGVGRTLGTIGTIDWDLFKEIKSGGDPIENNTVGDRVDLTAVRDRYPGAVGEASCPSERSRISLLVTLIGSPLSPQSRVNLLMKRSH